MDLYALARLIEEAGEVQGRKRLQKAVYLLQLSGGSFGAEYDLHLYGPYSSDVADATGFLSAIGVLDEEVEVTPIGPRYTYRVTEEGKAQLRESESPEGNREDLDPVGGYLDKFKELVCSDTTTWQMELAATMAYYHRELDKDWDKARALTADFKDVKPDASILARALELATKYCA